MKNKPLLLVILSAAVFTFLPFVFFSCISNPFGDDNVAGEKRQVSGVVQLSDQGSPQNVYVWMTGFSLSTRTDAQGQFQLTLPPKGSQGTPGGVNGFYNIYPFLANYRLDSIQTVIQNGVFVYSRGDINKDGKVASSRVLRRFLRVSTAVVPARVSRSFAGNIGVTVTLEAADSATVIFPKSVGDVLGALLIQRVGTEDISIFQALPGIDARDIELIGRTPKSRSATFNLVQTPLTPGQYEIIPYLLIRHQKVPKGLIESIAANVEALSPDYIKLPIHREGGLLEVTP
ncbi:MAG: hypothetical protein ALAOOOJD_04672 [bacterium]|nr:hypothetical protein [bacterium]